MGRYYGAEKVAAEIGGKEKMTENPSHLSMP